jgi:hypothetical protein
MYEPTNSVPLEHGILSLHSLRDLNDVLKPELEEVGGLAPLWAEELSRDLSRVLDHPGGRGNGDNN